MVTINSFKSKVKLSNLRSLLISEIIPIHTSVNSGLPGPRKPVNSGDAIWDSSLETPEEINKNVAAILAQTTFANPKNLAEYIALDKEVHSDNPWGVSHAEFDVIEHIINLLSDYSMLAEARTKHGLPLQYQDDPTLTKLRCFGESMSRHLVKLLEDTIELIPNFGGILTAKLSDAIGLFYQGGELSIAKRAPDQLPALAKLYFKLLGNDIPLVKKAA